MDSMAGHGLMVRMGTVWDRAVEVLRGRANILAPIAIGAIFVPSVVNRALVLFADPASRTTAIVAAVVALLVLLANIWGQLAMLAVATHPATTRDDAARQATVRLLPALGVILMLGVLFALALVPPVIALMRAGVDFSQPTAMQSVPAGASGFIGLYTIAFVILALFVGARMLLLNPVILNERRGLGAIARSFRLTRGLTWRIAAVMVLFAIVLLVPTLAVQSIVGLIARLALGAESLPVVTFLASVAGAAVTTVFSVVAAAFTAQLYVATVAENGEVPLGG
ncbi:hypothetical protein ASG67_03505 [Sphingomonas sp. Leaf339]|nr:hypothetical protein ASG67_03505 [Sphingomonas sp. Leaf339]